ncbi:DUF1499 domain-containing protein [Pseudohalocynthiibacter aestuariivivens]|uniref:DUF1499 domain-containing protein n=1 Tax=Pseudohalocynthiibacter aestuariivivens TaxID=1591409 RepID=A0ABV5JKT4_9RHOB|nr:MULTISPECIES: DUF1499 domain-containing protein [Pseudohalocynthiibacter]MBS9716543.1 DUF1499 domain-containing protein [Pseudohalocynthiibacter aestuariivivens]MCK0101613.1 DUF1499 domain-containing protein [Pseudohalocynthiibacter sp. F2068]
MTVFVKIFLGLLILVLAYLRLAPGSAEDWHTLSGSNYPLPCGQNWNVERGSVTYQADWVGLTPTETLSKIESVVLDTARTHRFAGSIQSGQVTYITRSAVFGFPDYTTIYAEPTEDGSRVVIFGRLRFGRSDLGVNAARVEGWVKALERL